MPSERKIAIVEKLAGKVSRAKSMVFTNYQGLTHRQLEELRKALRAVDAELVVTKNTLLKRALEGKWKIENFSGPTATLFAYSDPIASLRELARAMKSFKMPMMQFGILDGQTLTGEELLQLSTLPSREVLIAQLIGNMQAPIYGLHRSLSWNLQKLVMILKAIENRKKGGVYGR